MSVGDAVPPFELSDTHGATVSSADFAGRPIAVFFFPYAFTGVCTGELHALADQHPAIAARAELVAISTDTRYALRVFAEQEGLPFPLLSDFWPHGAVAQAWGCFDPARGCAERLTVLSDAEHRVAWTDRSELGEPRDTDRLLDAVRHL